MANSKTTSTGYSCFIFPVLCFILVFLTSLIFIVFGIIITKFSVILKSNNKIYVPKGTNLYDLETFNYRNDSIYRYDSKLVVGKNFVYTEGILDAFVDEDRQRIVISSIHYENRFSVRCEGVCKCYSEHASIDSRRISSLVYSHRYVSTVIVSVLGLAVSKFVNNHINLCYENAKRILNIEDDSSSSILTCSMENSECDDGADFFVKNEDGEIIKRDYLCKGHCLEKRKTETRYVQEAAQIAMAEMDCTNQWTRTFNVEILESDHVSKVLSTKRIPGKENVLYYQNLHHQLAVQKFRKFHLVPFCGTFVTRYLYRRPDNNYQYKVLKPCSASHDSNTDPISSNIKCYLEKDYVKERTEPSLQDVKR